MIRISCVYIVNSSHLTLIWLKFNRAIADYLSSDLPYALSPDDVYLTIGCIQAIEVILIVLACPIANILLPRPNFPYYEAHAASLQLEVHHFDLNPKKVWEVDLESVEALADENTTAMVIINPGNPCGSVYTHQHLKKVGCYIFVYFGNINSNLNFPKVRYFRKS